MWSTILYLGLSEINLWFIMRQDLTYSELLTVFSSKVIFVIRWVILLVIYLYDWTKPCHILALNENKVSEWVKCGRYCAAAILLPLCV